MALFAYIFICCRCARAFNKSFLEDAIEQFCWLLKMKLMGWELGLKRLEPRMDGGWMRKAVVDMVVLVNGAVG